MSEKNTRLYELGFVLVPTTSETEVPAFVDSIKEIIGTSNGAVASEGTPEFIDLAYVMERTVGSKTQKYSQGYFGWIKFDLDPELLSNVKKALDSKEGILRYILVKTTETNTIVFKKPKIEPKRESVVPESELLDDEMADDGLVDDQSLDHERLPSVEEDIASGEMTNASEEAQD